MTKMICWNLEIDEVDKWNNWRFGQISKVDMGHIMYPVKKYLRYLKPNFYCGKSHF